MFSGTYPMLMAEYNRFMNQRLYAACADIPDSERKRDQGAFFKSLHGTLDHILWGDRNWLGRFDGKTYPVGGVGEFLYADFSELRAAREQMDQHLAGLGGGRHPSLAGAADDLDQQVVQIYPDPPALGAGGANVQPPDASSRPGPYLADPDGRRRWSHGCALDARAA